MKTALINANVLTTDGFKDRQSVLINDGKIVGVYDDETCPTGSGTTQDVGGNMLLPGFLDLQVNGGGGVLFNDSPTVEGIRAIGEAHRAFGTTAFLPTLISDDHAVMAAAIGAVDAAIAEGVPGVVGIHLEGPFLNAERRGVHDASKFGSIGERDIHLMSSLKRGKTLVTLAPEKTTPDAIKSLTDRGVIVAAGHTQASYDQTREALDAGLTGFTHLFNAMKPMQSRAPGIIAAALEDNRAWCGIIADGHHVHPAMLRLALRAKIGEQIFLVTDAMPSVGSKDKQFSLGNLNVEVLDGKCVTISGTLAGSDLDMLSAVRNAQNFLNIPLERAVDMASRIPAKFMGLGDQMGDIKVGQQANLVLINKSFEVEETWINGVPA